MEERKLKIMFNKAGGTAGKGGYTTRISIPKSWLDKLGITIDEREVKVSFDGEKIVIEKEKK